MPGSQTGNCLYEMVNESEFLFVSIYTSLFRVVNNSAYDLTTWKDQRQYATKLNRGIGINAHGNKT